jgi:hypothetical protein
MSPNFAPAPIVYKNGANLNFKNEVDCEIAFPKKRDKLFLAMNE